MSDEERFEDNREAVKERMHRLRRIAEKGDRRSCEMLFGEVMQVARQMSRRFGFEIRRVEQSQQERG